MNMGFSNSAQYPILIYSVSLCFLVLNNCVIRSIAAQFPPDGSVESAFPVVTPAESAINSNDSPSNFAKQLANISVSKPSTGILNGNPKTIIFIGSIIVLLVALGVAVNLQNFRLRRALERLSEAGKDLREELWHWELYDNSTAQYEANLVWRKEMATSYATNYKTFHYTGDFKELPPLRDTALEEQKEEMWRTYIEPYMYLSDPNMLKRSRQVFNGLKTNLIMSGFKDHKLENFCIFSGKSLEYDVAALDNFIADMKDEGENSRPLQRAKFFRSHGKILINLRNRFISARDAAFQLIKHKHVELLSLGII